MAVGTEASGFNGDDSAHTAKSAGAVKGGALDTEKAVVDYDVNVDEEELRAALPSLVCRPLACESIKKVDPTTALGTICLSGTSAPRFSSWERIPAIFRHLT